MVLWSDPFVRIFPPAIEGRDLNPMLQHPGLIFHPPLLYLGYGGGLMVAASVALASLLRGEFDGTCARICWRWALRLERINSGDHPSVLVGLLRTGLGRLVVLGSGGKRLFTATAFCHSAAAQFIPDTPAGIFRHWSLLLAIVTLMLSLLGTLIVRSGILVSVHAFALDNVRAVPLFGLFALISLASLALYGWRARDGGPVVRFRGYRGMLILATLLLFCAVLLIMLVGTLYPMIYGLLGWGRLSVGAPYFNRATLPFALLMLVVIVLATFVSGKRAQLQRYWRMRACCYLPRGSWFPASAVRRSA